MFQREQQEYEWWIDGCFLLVYRKQVYATCFEIYLGRYQANSMENKLSYLNLVAQIWIHIMQFF
jgi:hypothetical protein